VRAGSPDVFTLASECPVVTETLAGGDAAALGVRALLELVALVAVGYWGYRMGPGALRYVLAVAAPLALAVGWGALVSPNAPARLPDPWRLSAETFAFALATAALVGVGRPALAAGFAAVALVDGAVLHRRGLR